MSNRQNIAAEGAKRITEMRQRREKLDRDCCWANWKDADLSDEAVSIHLHL